MLSNLPKFADRNFIIGFFLPALLAILAAIWVFFPNAPVFSAIRTLSLTEDAFGQLAYLVLGVWVLSILLMTTNHMQYRMLEGYLPPVSWLVPLKWWQQRCFARLNDFYVELTQERKTIERLIQRDTDDKAKTAHSAECQNIRRRMSNLKRTLLTYYPTSQDELLPTRFGNTIKAFEVYPREAYGADAILVWLRLASVVPKGFTRLIDSARAQVDCFVNVTFLSLIIAVAAFARGLQIDISHKTADFSDPAGIYYFMIAGAGVFAAWLSYLGAIAQAIAWGDLVKSAFDCYLPALGKQLGYKLPCSAEERRAFWLEFDKFVTYLRPMTKDRWLFDECECPGDGKHPETGS
jgi:hypothetical protein